MTQISSYEKWEKILRNYVSSMDPVLKDKIIERLADISNLGPLHVTGMTIYNGPVTFKVDIEIMGAMWIANLRVFIAKEDLIKKDPDF